MDKYRIILLFCMTLFFSSPVWASEDISVDTLTIMRLSSTEMELIFQDELDYCTERYQVMRRRSDAGAMPQGADSVNESSWQCIAEIPSDGVSDGTMLAYRDIYSQEELRQYQYYILPVLGKEVGEARAVPGNTVYGSNMMICIDPGHYGSENVVYAENSESDHYYAEGEFTLEVALKLREILENRCGIGVILTRDSSSIYIDGYSDGYLDQGHISLRGEAAAGCDFFLSIHTNANLDYANGYPTQAQPRGITKTLVIVNIPAMNDRRALEIGNAIGTNLSKTNYELNISEIPDFRTAYDISEMENWTDAWNDSLEKPGAICYRMSETRENSDYYGVLRGSANVGVPGMIVEHAYHTVPEMRTLAANGILSELWADADARSIAEGTGFEINHPNHYE